VCRHHMFFLLTTIPHSGAAEGHGNDAN
jgi:hypothetical protein